MFEMKILIFLAVFLVVVIIVIIAVSLMFQKWLNPRNLLRLLLVSIKLLVLQYGRLSKELTYCKQDECTYCMGNQVSLSCIERGCPAKMS